MQTNHAYGSAGQAAILRKAAMFIKKGFTKGALARNAKEEKVNYSSLEACSFCTIGAVNKAASSSVDSEAVLDFISDELKHRDMQAYGDIGVWNDRDARAQDDVVKFLRSCARKLQRQAK